MSEILKKPDSELQKFISKPQNVNHLAAALADYVSDENNFPELGNEAKTFVAKIKADEGLRNRIAANLSQNPQALRNMANFANGSLDLKDPKNAGIKGAIRETLTKPGEGILTNPDVLADAEFIRRLNTKFDQARDFGKGGIGAMLSGMGINLGPLTDMLGGLFKQIGSFFNAMFGQFSNGSFKLMSNMNPGDQGFGGMWKNFQAGMERGQQFEGRKEMLMKYAEPMARPGAEGLIGDGRQYEQDGSPKMVKVKQADGTEIEQQLRLARADHSFEIKTINGSSHQVFLTDGLSPQREAGGTYTWTMATKVKDGRVEDINEFVVDTAESQRIYRALQEAAAADPKRNGRPLNVSDPALQTQDPILQRAPQTGMQQAARTTEMYNGQTGHMVRVEDSGVQGSQPALTPAPDQQAPVRPPNQPSANERDWTLVGT